MVSSQTRQGAISIAAASDQLILTSSHNIMPPIENYSILEPPSLSNKPGLAHRKSAPGFPVCTGTAMTNMCLAWM